ncbi:MAG: hypothetical protein ACYDB2_12390 [Acidimicrobiales bacterium]
MVDLKEREIELCSDIDHAPGSIAVINSTKSKNLVESFILSLQFNDLSPQFVNVVNLVVAHLDSMTST